LKHAKNSQLRRRPKEILASNKQTEYNKRWKTRFEAETFAVLKRNEDLKNTKLVLGILTKSLLDFSRLAKKRAFKWAIIIRKHKWSKY